MSEINAKLTLSNTQQIRLIKSAVIETIIVSTDSQLYKDMTEASSKYSKHMLSLPKEARIKNPIGLPHHHRWNAMLALYSKSTDPNIKEAVQKLIARYESITTPTARFRAIQEEVKVVVLARSFHGNKKKLEVNTVPGSDSFVLWMKFLVPAIVAEGGVLKEGQASRGDLETRLQSMLDK